MLDAVDLGKKLSLNSHAGTFVPEKTAGVLCRTSLLAEELGLEESPSNFTLYIWGHHARE